MQWWEQEVVVLEVVLEEPPWVELVLAQVVMPSEEL